jgi:uncharacterized membrane protein
MGFYVRTFRGMAFLSGSLFVYAAAVLRGQDNSAASATNTNSIAQAPYVAQNNQKSRAKTRLQPGQLPDTVSAPSFTVRDKFDYRVVQTFGMRGFAGAAMGAAIGQARDSPSEWGGGTSGFAERYASGFAGNFSRQVFAFTLESAFHEDPRYFPSEDQSMKKRAINALKQAIFAKTDSGGDTFAYARVFSAFGAAQLTNAWQPKSTGSVGAGLLRGVITLGGDTAYNFLQEFVPFTRPRSLRHRR